MNSNNVATGGATAVVSVAPVKENREPEPINGVLWKRTVTVPVSLKRDPGTFSVTAVASAPPVNPNTLPVPE